MALLKERHACAAVYLQGRNVYTDLPVFDGASVTTPNGLVTKITFLDSILKNPHAFVSDENWSNGIAKNWAGFYIPYFSEINNYLIKGAIILHNQEARKIINLERSNNYVNIYLEGGTIHTSPHASPRDFIVINNELPQ